MSQSAAIKLVQGIQGPQGPQGATGPSFGFYAVDSGTINAFAVTIAGATTAAGTLLAVKAANSNTGASTLALNGGSPANIYKLNSSVTLVSGDIIAGQIFTIISDGTHWQMESPTANDVQLGGDLGNTTASPQVLSTHLTAPLPLLQGGTAQTAPALAAGSNITITGTWPNNTISAAGGGLPSYPYGSSQGAGGVNPDDVVNPTPPSGAGLHNDEFTEAALDTGGTRFTSAVAWAWLNQPTGATATLSNGALVLYNPTTGASTWNMSAIDQAESSGSWTYQCKVRVQPTNGTVYAFAGMFAYASGSGDLITWAVLYDLSNTFVVRADGWTNFTTDHTQLGLTALQIFTAGGYNNGPFMYLQMSLSGTTITFSYSFDGILFTTYGTASTSATTYLNPAFGTTTAVGLWSAGEGSAGNTYGMIDWFRRTA